MNNNASESIEEFFKKFKRTPKYPEGTFKTMEDCKAVIEKYGEFINNVKKDWRAYEDLLPKYSPSDIVYYEYEDLKKSRENDVSYYDFEKKVNRFLFELLRDLSWDMKDTLDCIPEQFKTGELYALIVAQNGYVLQHIPENFWTDTLCLAAFLQVGMVLDYVPEELVKIVNKWKNK